VQRIAKDMYEGGKVVSAVCHGPCALANVKLSDGTFLVAGKEVAAFTNAEEDAVQVEHFFIDSTHSHPPRDCRFLVRLLYICNQVNLTPSPPIAITATTAAHLSFLSVPRQGSFHVPRQVC
jgi:hypothetical protein